MAAETSYTTPEVRGGSREEQTHVQEGRLRGHRRAERSYSMFKVRRGGHEEIPLVQDKEQRLHFAGAAVKKKKMFIWLFWASRAAHWIYL